MSEYNIQMNKYNALNAEYDQLYPQPMKHASTHAKDGDDPITPSSIGAAELGADGKVLASQVDAYSKEESISAETRTALSLSETATPDDAFAEIARQLSESSSAGFQMDLLWENANPNSDFAAQTISLDLSSYVAVKIDFLFNQWWHVNSSHIIKKGIENYQAACVGAAIAWRYVSVTETGVIFGLSEYKTGYGDNNIRRDSATDAVPIRIYGIK